MEKPSLASDAALASTPVEKAIENVHADAEVTKDTRPDMDTEEKITQLSKSKLELGSTIDDLDSRISQHTQSLHSVRAALDLPERAVTNDPGSVELKDLIDAKKKAEDKLEKKDASLTSEEMKAEDTEQERLNNKKIQEGLYYCSQSTQKFANTLHERVESGFDSLVDDQGLSAIDIATGGLDQVGSEKEIDSAQLQKTVSTLYQGLDAFGRAESDNTHPADSAESLESMAYALKSLHEGVGVVKNALSVQGKKYLDSVNILQKIEDEVIPPRYDFLVRKINVLNEYYR